MHFSSRIAAHIIVAQKASTRTINFDAQPGRLAFAVIDNMLAQILGVQLQRYAMTGNKILFVASDVFQRAE